MHTDDINKMRTTVIKRDNIVNSNPIEDLRSWQRVIANRYGIYGNLITMNNRTFSLVMEFLGY